MPDFSFSVYDNNYSQTFELNSTIEVNFPGYKSNESYIGRKCFEFEWKGGSKGFAVGIFFCYFKITCFFFMVD